MDRAEGHTVPGVAHDLRNLLTAITGHAVLARDAMPPDHAARADLDEIIAAASRAEALTEELLTGAPGPQSAASLDLLVRDALPLLQSAVGPSVTMTVALDAPDAVRLTAQTLQRVLLNLSMNAREAMDGAGELTIATCRVGDHSLEIRVADTGPGFSGPALEHLFEPGFSTRDDGRAHGLGLATCRELVTAVGGRLEVDGDAQAGASIRVVLPRA